MKHSTSTPGHSGNDEGPHGFRWSWGSALHIVGSLGEFWSSDLNRAAVDMVDPMSGQVVLDLGAGLGPATVEAAKRVMPGGRVIAVDPSSTMRRVLGVRRLWQSARSAIDIRNGTAEAIPVTTGSVDACWAVNAVHHFDDLMLAANELARVLKPGGTLVLIEEDLTDCRHMCHSGDGADSDGPIPVDPDHLNDLLQAAGLSVTESVDRTISGVTATVTSSYKPVATS